MRESLGMRGESGDEGRSWGRGDSLGTSLRMRLEYVQTSLDLNEQRSRHKSTVPLHVHVENVPIAQVTYLVHTLFWI